MVSTRISEGREYTMIGGVETTPFGNLGVGYVGSTDPIDGLDLSDWEGNNPVKYTTQTLYVSLAKDLNKEMRMSQNMGTLLLGMNLKFSSRKLGTASGLSQSVGSSFDMDLASIFKLNDNLSLGMSLQNFLAGEKAREILNLNTVEERKSAVLYGASGKLLNGVVTWVVEGDELGCELRPVKGLAIRAGRGKDSITSGIGININGFGVDYAYLQKDSPVHYWSISIIPEKFTEPAVSKASVGLE
jgi:hypothetical protein